MEIGIVGGGWYGCHIALVLSKLGHKVTIFEKNDDIFDGVSGKFGIRLHKGPHYPRSDSTRQYCRETFDKFCATYPELIIDHEYSVYALGELDADGNPPKVDTETFMQVCHESIECKEVNRDEFGYEQMHVAMSIDEPSVALGERLRSVFKEKLKDAGVTIKCGYRVENLIRNEDKTILISEDGTECEFDQIINSTGYQSLISPEIKEDFPIEMEVVYQPCLALSFKDLQPGNKPFSFIVMDGWFPCLMPYVNTDNYDNTYILTHGSYTIMASCPTPEEAHAILNSVSNEFIETKVKPPAVREMCRFWPEFADRFKYLGWEGAVLAKLVTKREFRSAVTFEYKGTINIIPGKINNIFDAEEEVIALLEKRNCISHKGITYVSKGVLDNSRGEISEKPALGEPNTGKLNTWRASSDYTIRSAPQSLFKEKSGSKEQKGLDSQSQTNPNLN
ncbi:FAD-dependent oxidoreductase [Legionella sp.]|uniref:FAD-dependent oxidoreductase n=1 Tax=Legionella sp. TaxID=459 RepID=UPI000CAD3905|nr:FAD-dependent oxidoreductase [Legionella sp.]PJE17996.1 MAG: hypothetical protein CK430_01125 [Legionella sp.]